MSYRFRYLLGIVLLLVLFSAFADARERANGTVRTATGETCIECAAYAPMSGVYSQSALKDFKP